jgi:hypothetical protein
VPQAKVTDLEVGTDRISFDVDEVGTPILVKASYFPNWKVDGADGPYRVAPNLMVVVPTDEHVELSYGRQPVEWIGYALTLLGIALTIFLATRPRLAGPAPAPSHGRPDDDELVPPNAAWAPPGAGPDPPEDGGLPPPPQHLTSSE